MGKRPFVKPMVLRFLLVLYTRITFFLQGERPTPPSHHCILCREHLRHLPRKSDNPPFSGSYETKTRPADFAAAQVKKLMRVTAFGVAPRFRSVINEQSVRCGHH